MRLAAPPSLADVFYPALAFYPALTARVLERLPRVRLELREELTKATLAGLRQGRLDLAVVWS
jgi:DNA-binding transcriptional LysR family regulator